MKAKNSLFTSFLLIFRPIVSFYQLSKSSFVKSVQCLKQLYLYKNFYHLRDPIPKDRQVIFDRGINVGLLAQQLFPGGIDASPSSVKKYDEAVAKTAELIASGAPIIYEAAFVFNEVLVALDLLVKKNNKWYGYEVKSSARITRTYVLDASLQYYVVKNSLPDLEDFFIVTINTQYTRGRALDVQQLFRFTSVKKDVGANFPYIENRLSLAKQTVANSEMPDVPIGEHCLKPYKCDYFGTCWKHLPEKNIFQLNAAGIAQQVNWYRSGQRTIEAIENTGELSHPLSIQINAVKAGKEHIDKEKINRFLAGIQYPLGFFDIEHFAPAVPVFEGTKPYQQLPFLFSLHVQEQANGPLTSDHFFAEAGKDPRKDFLLACIEKLSKVNSILAYGAATEVSIFSMLAAEFPEYKEAIEAIQGRIVDLSMPYSNFWYFHPKALGGASLKHLYTRYFDDTSFETLSVNSGATANYAYIELFEEENLFRQEELKQQLIDYCNTDTLATARLFQLLVDKAAG
jgi:hypothetical protein